MPTVKQRLEMRAKYAKQGQPICCSKCGREIHCSFDIDAQGKPVHYSCAGAGRVKGLEDWERPCRNQTAG